MYLNEAEALARRRKWYLQAAPSIVLHSLPKDALTPLASNTGDAFDRRDHDSGRRIRAWGEGFRTSNDLKKT